MIVVLLVKNMKKARTMRVVFVMHSYCKPKVVCNVTCLDFVSFVQNFRKMLKNLVLDVQNLFISGGLDYC